MRELVIKKHVGACHRALVVEPPADIAPMTVRFKPRVHAVRMEPGLYPAQRTI